VLYIRRGTPFVSQLTGGGQERQRRAGTENVAGIVGQAVALQAAEEGRPAFVASTTRIRNRLIEAIIASVPDSHLNGDPVQRLANNVNVSIPGVRGDQLVLALDKEGIAASAGAACGSSTWEPSHVLLAMGLSMPEAVGGLRLTLSAETTDADADAVLAVLPRVVDQLRPLAAAG
jgi:cysteine desulfurase